MTIIITLFYISLAIIVLIIVRKVVVIHPLKFTLIEGVEKELHGKFYEKMHEAWRTVNENYLMRIRSFAITLFYTLVHKVLQLLLIVGKKFKVYHDRWYDMVKGKGVIKKKGSVSFFLREISEHKKQSAEEK
ncbi:MAG: hypothetical protein AAB628_02670 [Patescibacteria group bacterium]